MESAAQDAAIPAPSMNLLPRLTISADLLTISFIYSNKTWICTLNSYECVIAGDVLSPLPNSVVSPDGKKDAFRKDHNIWIHDLETNEQYHIMKEGETNSSIRSV